MKRAAALDPDNVWLVDGLTAVEAEHHQIFRPAAVILSLARFTLGALFFGAESVALAATAAVGLVSADAAGAALLARIAAQRRRSRVRVDAQGWTTGRHAAFPAIFPRRHPTQ